MKRFGRILIGWLVWVALAMFAGVSVAAAANPWEALVPFRKIDAEPGNPYPVAQSNGPWMIMATTFRGDDALEQAQSLVYELRRKHKIPAYTYEKAFDYTKTERGRGIDRYGRPKKMRYQEARVVREVAVLVGDFDTIDEPAAEKLLKKVKALHPDSLKAASAESSAIHTFKQAFALAGAKRAKMGPMGHAIIVTNPLLPPEYFNSKGVDRLVLEMNQDVKYSLLDCPGRYTVKVVTFNGAVIIDERKIDEVERGKSMTQKLEEAAEKAHLMTIRLRQKGIEAYEFHDRTSSIVCVGNFAALGTPRQDGGFEPNPAILAVMQQFGAEQEFSPDGAPKVEPKYEEFKVGSRIAKIFFDLQPQPIEVPRRSIAADYQRSMLNDR